MKAWSIILLGSVSHTDTLQQDPDRSYAVPSLSLTELSFRPDINEDDIASHSRPQDEVTTCSDPIHDRCLSARDP